MLAMERLSIMLALERPCALGAGATPGPLTHFASVPCALTRYRRSRLLISSPRASSPSFVSSLKKRSGNSNESPEIEMMDRAARTYERSRRLSHSRPEVM